MIDIIAAINKPHIAIQINTIQQNKHENVYILLYLILYGIITLSIIRH